MAGARQTALRTLVACWKQGAWSDGFLKKAIRGDGLDRRDAAFATRLCMGVLQNELRLDWYLEKLSNTRLSRLEPVVLCALRMALYQIQCMDRVPERAAVSESVELTRKYAKNPRAAGMVNGILRNYLRQRSQLGEPVGESWAQTMSLQYSHPQWLVEAFEKRLGREEARALLALNNTETPTVAQVNTLRATVDQTAASLEAQGVGVERHPWLEGCLLLEGAGDLERLEAYREGWLYIQDAAAHLAALALGALPGERVLDCCAAPGGKSFALSIQMEGRGEVVSCDIHPHKLRLIAAGRDRLGLGLIQPVLQNAAQRREDWAERFDRVIADVPCSGLGIIRKKPDIRYKDPDPLAGLPEVQFGILCGSADYVRPGGSLVYSTCTLLQRENEDVVERFLRARPDFRLSAFALPGVGRSEGMLTLWPQRHGTDGFFLASLKKQG